MPHECPSVFSDHPRLRGEKKLVGIVFREEEGSSPLARGKVAEIGAQVRADRIIPACAGKRGVVRKRAL